MFLDKTYFQPNKIKTIGKLDFTEKHRKYLEEKGLDEYINIIVSPKQGIQKLNRNYEKTRFYRYHFRVVSSKQRQLQYQ
jgi:hypothetical protein